MAQWVIALGLGLWLLGSGVGLANLADLSLQGRRRQIGLCRALGARAGQIRQQLRCENLLLVGGGAALGLGLWQALWQLWPPLSASLPAATPAQHALAWGLVLLSGQCALWPVIRIADAIAPGSVSRPA